MKFPVHPPLFGLILLCAFPFISCDSTDEQKTDVSHYQMGVLPQQTQALIEQEFKLYRAQHPELDESTAKHNFDVIQIMSQQAYDPFTAAWADRRKLAKTWLKTQIEDIYSPQSVTQDLIQEAVNAYAFNSGYPALVTVSHLLIQNAEDTSPTVARENLEKVRKELLTLPQITDEDLANAALRLMQAGFKVNNDRDLTFPRHAVPQFFGESTHYNLTVEPFSEASFQLSAQNPLSEIVETQFGFHIILFKSLSPEKKADPIKDAEFMRSQIVYQGRKLITQQELEKLTSESDIRAIDREHLLDILSK